MKLGGTDTHGVVAGWYVTGWATISFSIRGREGDGGKVFTGDSEVILVASNMRRCFGNNRMR